MPAPFADIGLFRMLLIMRCLRPDKVVPAVRDFVEDTLGKRYVEPLPFNLGACYAESSSVSPLIFVLSAGSDPTAALVTFAEDREMSNRIGFIHARRSTKRVPPGAISPCSSNTSQGKGWRSFKPRRTHVRTHAQRGTRGEGETRDDPSRQRYTMLQGHSSSG